MWLPAAAGFVCNPKLRQTGKLDWSYIRRQLEPLAELKGAPEILEALERRRVEFER
jgi:hypothetical protein